MDVENENKEGKNIIRYYTVISMLLEEKDKAHVLKTCCFAIQMQPADRTANSFHVLKKNSIYTNFMHFSLGHTTGKMLLHDDFQTTREQAQMWH